ncbi:MAG: hypothetical protein IT569_08190, partial [Leptospiraceae bacterium]|nr:hypothetical protein [Leptospiraceae bacterium]
MNENPIYKEKILSTGLVVILGVSTLAITSIFLFQLIYGPIGSKPAPDIVYAILAISFFLLTWNFAFLNIEITTEKIKVNYGIIQKSLKWSD